MFYTSKSVSSFKFGCEHGMTVQRTANEVLWKRHKVMY